MIYAFPKEELLLKTIDSLIAQSCQLHPQKVALRHKVGGTWQDLTYRTLWNKVEQVAAGLIKSGFSPGQHAAILAPSSPRWIASYLGILRAGGVAIPIDKELKAAELLRILSDCEARILFVEGAQLETMLEILPDLPHLERLVLLYGDPLSGPIAPQLSEALDELGAAWRDMVTALAIPEERVSHLEHLARRAHALLLGDRHAPRTDQPKHDFLSPMRQLRSKLVKDERLISFSDFQDQTPAPPNPRQQDDIAIILYTSGTTGRSKGAMLSHANIVSNIITAVSHFGLDGPISTLSFLPVNHVFEQVCGVLLPLHLGGTVSFAESLKKIGENLSEVKPSFLLGVPAVYQLLLNRIQKNIQSKTLSRTLYNLPLTRGIVTSKVKKAIGMTTTFVSGGAALDPVVAEGFRNLGLSLYQGYGITETSPVIAAESPLRRRAGSVGYPIKDVDVKIIDPNDEGVGEIWVRGPNVMQGYYKNEQATAEILTDGWYHTGDLGRFDAEGYLYICGRVKNLIVTPNGKNVYPEEVENELLKSPYIAEIMVYGHKVSATAEEVYAIIYPDFEALERLERDKKKGALTTADIEGLVRREVLDGCKNLADYKRIKKFTLREDEFPKTTTRKIKRFAVEAEISAVE